MRASFSMANMMESAKFLMKVGLKCVLLNLLMDNWREKALFIIIMDNYFLMDFSNKV